MPTKPILLADLPLSPSGKTGWPWTTEISRLPDRRPDGAEWPRISIVTPSLNQDRFIEETIRSVLLQGYPNLEYIIIDGGSTDETLSVIRRYESHLDFVISEPDGGQADALNKGFRRATGSILAFINSDDFYLPGAFARIAEQFAKTSAADLVYGGCYFVDQAGQELIEHHGDISTLEDILDFWNVWSADREIVQPETFWHRSIFEKTGLFITGRDSSFCYEYWCRMLIAGAKFQRIDEPLACFRLQPAQRSQREKDRSLEAYLEMARPWLWDNSLPIPSGRRRALQSEWLYEDKYIPAWKESMKRNQSSLRRWAGTALLCARYPGILGSRDFRKRREKLTFGAVLSKLRKK